MRLRVALRSIGVLAMALPALAQADDVVGRLGFADGFAVENASGSVERLRVEESTGDIWRNGVKFVHTTGTDGTFVGDGAGNTGAIFPGFSNSAFGADALGSVTTGDSNSAFGAGSLANATSASFNSAFGSGALAATTAGRNSAFGTAALLTNTVGDLNAAFGGDALRLNTTGISNSAFGVYALRNLTTGSNNAALGQSAARSQTTGVGNVAIGGSAARNQTTGNRNVHIGLNSGYSATGGFDNVFVGVSTGSNQTSGDDNIYLGAFAGNNQSDGSHNIYLAHVGVPGEDGQIRIGTPGTHTQTYLVGEASLFDSSGGSALFFGGSGTNGPHGIVLDDETPGAGVQIFYRTGPNQLVIEKESTGTAGDGTDAFSYDRDTDVFYLGGPVGIQNTAPAFPLQVGTNTSNGNGAHVTPGGTWTNGSSRDTKEGFEPVDPDQVLAAVSALPITRWRYRGSDEGDHLGPVAEDFHASFGLGDTDKYIATVDADGVALAAIQALARLAERQQEQLGLQREEITALRGRLDGLEAR